MYEKIKEEAALAAQELLEAAKLSAGQIVIIGCSTSEVCGQRIGTASVPKLPKPCTTDSVRCSLPAGYISPPNAASI